AGWIHPLHDRRAVSRRRCRRDAVGRRRPAAFRAFRPRCCVPADRRAACGCAGRRIAGRRITARRLAGREDERLAVYTLVRRFITTGVLYLFSGLALGGWLLVRRELFGIWPHPHLLSAHAHAVLVGFVMFLIF